VVQEGFNPRDEPAWRALFNLIDDDKSGYIGAYEMYNYLERIAGKFDWQDDGDGKMDFKEFVVAMTTRLPPSTEMAIKMYAHSLIGRDLTQETSYPTEQKSNSKAKKTASFSKNIPASINVDDRSALTKLFNHIDSSGTGYLDRKTVQTKLAGMLGSFEWKDDGDGAMDVNEFIEAMRHVAPSTRLTAVMYAKTAL
jgi:Ca2+-binding EF-hand superfamily protein